MRTVLCRLLFLLALAPSLAAAQSITIRDGDSPTIRAGVTSEKRLKVDASGPVLSVTTSTTADASDALAFGRSYFLSTGLTQGTNGNGPAIFLDDLTVARYAIFAATTSLGLQQSSDGGRTWGNLIDVGLGLAGASPYSIVKTSGATARYVIGFSSTGTNAVASSVSPSGPWAFSTGTNPITSAAGSAIMVGVSGSTVLAFGGGLTGATDQTAKVCRSTDNGQTFSGCVTVNPAVSSGLVGVSTARQALASPSAGIWLLADNTGRVWRSSDDGTTWTLVLTLTSVAAEPIACLTATTCLVVDNGTAGGSTVRISSDAGLTWGTTSRTPTTYTPRGICAFSGTVLDVFSVQSLPTTVTGTAVGAFRSTDGGLSWVPANVIGGDPLFAGATLDYLSAFVCRPTGRSFVSGFRAVEVRNWGWAGITSANLVGIIGANGVQATVNAAGNLGVIQQQPGTGAVVADLAVTVASQALVAASATRLGIICANGDASNGIRVGFGATPTATSGFLLLARASFSDTGTYAINVIRDTAAVANPTISCSTVSP